MSSSDIISSSDITTIPQNHWSSKQIMDLFSNVLIIVLDHFKYSSDDDKHIIIKFLLDNSLIAIQAWNLSIDDQQIFYDSINCSWDNYLYDFNIFIDLNNYSIKFKNTIFYLDNIGITCYYDYIDP